MRRTVRPWRTLVASALLLTSVPGPGSAARAEVDSGPGGHPLEFGLWLGHADFDDAIRFQNDVVYGLSLAAGIASWFRLGMELSQVTTRDRSQSEWTSAVIVGIMSRFEPWSASRLAVGALLGVSFMAFEERPGSDSISEGLDLGPSLRVALPRGWLARGDLFWRMQTFRLIPVDAAGVPTGEREETGYLWSRIVRVGLSHEF